MSAGDVGSTAFDALFRLIGGERLEGDVYQVPTKLVVRASTAKPRGTEVDSRFTRSQATRHRARRSPSSARSA